MRDDGWRFGVWILPGGVDDVLDDAVDEVVDHRVLFRFRLHVVNRILDQVVHLSALRRRGGRPAPVHRGTLTDVLRRPLHRRVDSLPRLRALLRLVDGGRHDIVHDGRSALVPRGRALDVALQRHGRIDDVGGAERELARVVDCGAAAEHVPLDVAARYGGGLTGGHARWRATRWIGYRHRNRF